MTTKKEIRNVIRAFVHYSKITPHQSGVLDAVSIALLGEIPEWDYEVPKELIRRRTATELRQMEMQIQKYMAGVNGDQQTTGTQITKLEKIQNLRLLRGFLAYEQMRLEKNERHLTLENWIEQELIREGMRETFATRWVEALGLKHT